MENGQKESFRVRVVSTIFTVLALAVFKPFGLDAWQWQAYIHLLAMFALGLSCCIVTEGILKFILRLPRSAERGVSYVIRRNLWFQFINTPLVALILCLYRHFFMSAVVESNKLSVVSYLETLVIIAFLSFAIGLYWRFKFRSRFLAVELEETRQLNEQLQNIPTAALPSKESQTVAAEDHHPVDSTTEAGNGVFTLTGNTNETVTLDIADLLYIEAVGNYVKIYHLCDGAVRNDMLRATSKQIEDELQGYPMIVRCHRAFLVNLRQVEQIVSKAGSMQLVIRHGHESIPVSRSNMAQVKETINASYRRDARIEA